MASIVFEVEAEVEGRITRAEPDIGVGQGVEDMDLSSVSILKWKRQGTNGVYISIDLLDGLDKVARDIVIRNITDAFTDEIEEAILSDA